jgi:hypothetical protein
LLSLSVLASCGGTWVDDDRNFERVFNFSKPPDVTVLHRYYWNSSHWTTEYRYFIAIPPTTKFVDGLTDARLAVPLTPEQTTVDSCGEKPQWFLPKTLTNYQAWKPKTADGYRIFRDRVDGTLFVCDQRL